MKFIVKRSQGKDAESYIQTYVIPFTPDEGKTVMDGLEYITLNLDGTLSYFRHSICNHGICGLCGVRVNGKVKLACETLADREEMVIEPKNARVIKDLVTE